MSKRPKWMDEYHEFREDVADYSMCLCGIPVLYHDRWEGEMLAGEGAISGD
jgi:hypothetical protein